MTAKEYLSRAYKINSRINSKIEQVTALRELATKATATLSDMPPSGTRNLHRMEDVICNIIDLENEINRDIDCLVDTKREISRTIKTVDNVELQLLLEKRFLCGLTWEQIAVEMGYSIRQVYRLRDSAYKEISKKI